MDFAIYLPDGGTAKLWGVAVTACGQTRVDPGMAYPPLPSLHPGDHLFGLPHGRRILDNYQLLWISAGHGVFESATTGTQEVGPGTAFLLFPNIWHRYAPDPETGWTEHFIEMTGPALEQLKKEGVLKPQAPLFQTGNDPRLLEGFNELGRLARESGPGSRDRMSALALYLLAQTIHTNHEPGQTMEERAVREAETRMREELGGRLKMRELARVFGIPYDRFRRRFKALTGLAPKQYHRQLQIRQAQESLLYSERSLGEIADELGFDSAFHFSAAFKEHAGQSPSFWRKAKRNSVRQSPKAS